MFSKQNEKEALTFLYSYIISNHGCQNFPCICTLKSRLFSSGCAITLHGQLWVGDSLYNTKLKEVLIWAISLDFTYVFAWIDVPQNCLSFYFKTMTNNEYWLDSGVGFDKGVVTMNKFATAICLKNILAKVPRSCRLMLLKKLKHSTK